MGASACQSRVSALSASLPALPGWGLVLGAYAQDFRARRGIELAKASLSLPADIGQPAIVLLKDAKYYGALLVGLNEDQATSACLAAAPERSLLRQARSKRAQRSRRWLA